MDHLEFHSTLAQAWDLIKRSNNYIEETSPWKVAKEGDARYAIQGTPAFAIDFKKAAINSWDDAQKQLDAALAAKGAK